MNVQSWKIWLIGICAILCIGFALTEAIPGNPLDRLSTDLDPRSGQKTALQENARQRWKVKLGLHLPAYPISIEPLALSSWPYPDTKKLFALTGNTEVRTAWLHLTEKWKGTDTLVWLHSAVEQGDTAAFFHWCKTAQWPISYAKTRDWTWYIPTLKFHAHNRFFRFLWGDGERAKGILRGDLGISYTTGQPVELQFSHRWWHSVALGFLALLFSTLMAGGMAFALGLRKQGSRWLPMVLLAFSAVPTFLAGTALLWIFANPDLFQWFPSGGMEPAGGFSNHNHGWSGTWFKMSFWILPLISLSYGLIVSFSLPWTQAVKNILAQPFFQTARAKGLGLYKAFFVHALPQLLPLMATMVSQALPALIGGSVVIETLFTWPGLGKLTIDAVFAKDQPVLVAMLTLSGILTLTIFLGSNLLQKWLDPRIENHG